MQPLLMLALAALLPACASLQPEPVPRAKPLRFPKATTTPGQPQLAGRITMVNTAGRFVLIDCGIGVLPEIGTALKAMRAGVESGVLAVSAERRGTTIVADIVLGEPQRGDEVFH